MSTNHLANETSPYLLQHAHNPVDWYPWGDVALQKAKELNKPILVSIGYSACHWCHVMEKESFEDEGTALTMNEHFINIKIDREERPDLDNIYMEAVQAMTGSGGWPLNVFLTPDKKPFYGGTYFPPVQTHRLPSWKDVLKAIATAWKEKNIDIENQAANLISYLQQSNSIGYTKENADQYTSASYHAAIAEIIMRSADRVWGGFGNAPKFPQTFIIQYLLQYYHFTKNKEAFNHALLSIDKMLLGGIYDQVGGGLARYSTDREWLAPHFEKMLYDNALLINVLSDAFQLTGKKFYADAIIKTIDFVQRELMNPDGGFYAALDADSEGEEGKYYVWSKKGIMEILGDEANFFCKYFDVSEEGNWEGENILRILINADQFAAENRIGKAELEERVSKSLKLLFEARERRIKPSLDDKIILSWNALMVSALCKAALVLKNEDYRELAVNTFEFLEIRFTHKNGSPELFHTYKSGQSKYPAFLDDYAFLIDACLHLYETTFNLDYLEKAKKYCQYVIDNFSDKESALFFYTNISQADLPLRKKEIYDSATSSGNSIMAKNLAKLSIIYDIADWKERVDLMLGNISELVKKYPASFSVWAMCMLNQFAGINEISIIGKNAVAEASKIFAGYFPNKIVMISSQENGIYPMLRGKFSTNETLFYLCKDYTCKKPFKTAQDLLENLLQLDKL